MSTVSASIRRGLQEAVAYAEGKADASVYRVTIPACCFAAIPDAKPVPTVRAVSAKSG